MCLKNSSLCSFWTWLHYRDLSYTSTCLDNRSLCSLDVSTLQRPDLQLHVSGQQEPVQRLDMSTL
jgi:hypothetical protein